MMQKQGETKSRSDSHLKYIKCHHLVIKRIHRISVATDLEGLGLKRCVLNSAASASALFWEGSTKQSLSFLIYFFLFLVKH